MKRIPKPKPERTYTPVPDHLKTHPNKCECPRCVGLEECHVCKLYKLDTDYCFNCLRLVY